MKVLIVFLSVCLIVSQTSQTQSSNKLVKKLFESLLHRTASSEKAARSIVAHRPSHPEEGKGLLSLFLPSSLQVENITLDVRTYTYDLLNKLFEVVAFFIFMILDQLIFSA